MLDYEGGCFSGECNLFRKLEKLNCLNFLNCLKFVTIPILSIAQVFIIRKMSSLLKKNILKIHFKHLFLFLFF